MTEEKEAEETHTDANGLPNLAPGLLKDGLEVLAALRRLFGDGARDEVALRVRGDLASRPHLPRGFDGLAVWAGGY